MSVGGVLSLEGGTANDTAVNSGNRDNTYIRFAPAGTSNDWAYLRQIGGNNQMKMALDFHDDSNDCKFLIRGVHSSGQDPDVITNRFSVVDDKVAVGSDSPTAKLDVEYNQGTLSSYNYSTTSTWHGKGLRLAGGSNSGGFLYGHDINHSIFLRQSPFSTNDHNAYCNVGYHAFYTGGHIQNQTEKMRIAQNGNVGIGTADPQGRLHISSGTSGDCHLIIQSDTDNNNEQDNPKIVFRQDGAINTAEIGIENSGGNPNMLALRGTAGIVFYDGSSSSVDIDIIQSTSTEHMRIESNGKVGIGTASPGEALHVVSSRNTRIHIEDGGSDNGSYFPGLVVNGGKPENDQTVMVGVVHDGNTSSYNYNRIGWYGGQGDRLYFNYLAGRNDYGLGDTTEAYLASGTSGNGAELNFTGQHRCFIHGIPHSQASALEGLIVSADNNKYIKMSGGIDAGSNAITANESLPVVSISTKSKDKKCFGVVSSSEDPETREDAFGSFVTVSQKELGDTRVYINSVGEGAMWVVNTADALESGDYITTSNVAGYGMKQDSEFLANYTVAKITMDCDFEPVTQPVQQIVKELSNVNYWVTTDYLDVSLEEYSNLTEENRQTITTTRYSNEEGDISPSEYSNLVSNVQATYSEIETTTYQQIERTESKTEQEGYTLEVREELVNVLDEHGQLQWEDHPTETEKAYKIRYLDADGKITTEANKVYTAAFVGCTYHCG